VEVDGGLCQKVRTYLYFCHPLSKQIWLQSIGMIDVFIFKFRDILFRTSLNLKLLVVVVCLGIGQQLSAQSITLDPLPGNAEFCPGQSVVITFVTLNMPPGLTYSVQMSTLAGTFTPATPLNSGNGSPISITFPFPLAAGNTYRMRVLSSDGVESNNFLFTVKPSPASNAGADFRFCSGDTVSLGVQPPAGSNFSYQWFPTAGVLNRTSRLPDATGSFSLITLVNNFSVPIDSVYTLRTTDPVTGCTADDEVRITLNPRANDIFAGDNLSVCENAGAVTLTGFRPSNAPPNGVGTWSGVNLTPAGVFTPNPTLIGNQVVTYTYTITFNGLSCPVSANRVITVVARPAVQAGGPQEVCKNEPFLQLTGGDPVDGIWSSTFGSVSQSGQFTPVALNPNTYQVTYTFRDPVTNCAASAVKNVTVKAVPLVDAGQNFSICSNIAPFILRNFVPASGGIWTGLGVSESGVFTPSANIVGLDNQLVYSFTGANGCVGRDTIIAAVIQSPRATVLKNDTFCSNLGPQVLLGGLPANGRWTGIGVDTSGTTFNPRLVPAGGVVFLNYIVNENGCSDTARKRVLVLSVPLVVAGPSNEICANALPFQFTGFSPVGGRWRGVGVDSLGRYTPNVNIVGLREMIYRIRTSDGCVDSAVKTVNVLPIPLARAGVDTALCTSNSVRIGMNPTPRNGYQWLTLRPSSLSSTVVSNPLVTLVNNGIKPDTVFYTLRAVDSTSNLLCRNQDTTRVIVFPKPISTAFFPAIKEVCQPDSFTLRARTAPGLAYQWLRNGVPINIASKQDSIIKVGVSGRYRLVVKFENINCSDTSFSDTLVVQPKFKPVVLGKLTYCQDTSTTIRSNIVQPGFTYLWRFNGNTISDSVRSSLVVNRIGGYSVVLVTNRGCRDTSNVAFVDSLIQPFLFRNADTSICAGGRAIWTAPAGFSYTWRNVLGETISTNDSLVATAAGQYVLQVFNDCKLLTDTMELIKVNPLPDFTVLKSGAQDTILCKDIPLVLSGPDGFRTYVWRSVITGLVVSQGFTIGVSDTLTDTLGLTVIDDVGCASSRIITFKVIDCPPDLYIPTAFSPQGDFINETWKLTGYDIQKFRLWIYNRWGEMVYFSEDIERPWDGTYKGVMSPSGSYQYVVEYEGDLNGARVNKKRSGSFTLLR